MRYDQYRYVHHEEIVKKIEEKHLSEAQHGVVREKEPPDLALGTKSWIELQSEKQMQDYKNDCSGQVPGKIAIGRLLCERIGNTAEVHQGRQQSEESRRHHKC